MHDTIGDIKNAFSYYKIYEAISDSISNENTTRKIIQLQMQFEFDKQMKEQEFEVRFQQVHSDFYKKLTDRYPDFSPNDLKLCAFLRLNMSTKEISAITYQSVNPLSTGRYRLRKKLGLEDHANLISFLNQV